MFENDPIYAPICCKTEEYKLFSSAEDKDEVVCELTDNGVNSQFGPVLGISVVVSVKPSTSFAQQICL
jgi:hypothetical protein